LSFPVRETEGRRGAALLFGVPSMKPSLEVKVLRGDRSQKTQVKRKAVRREAYAERSAERKSEPTNRNRI